MINDNLSKIKSLLPPQVQLVAVSKYHTVDEMVDALRCGQTVFAESRPQELAAKIEAFAALDVPVKPEWHFIGHLQTNKLKMVLPYVSLVQSVDSRHLLEEIDKWGQQNRRRVPVLLELHIAAEETKQGFTEEEIVDLLFDAEKFPNIEFRGLMGMASNTGNPDDADADFERIDTFMAYLVDLFPELDKFNQLSIGMSGDWQIAIRHGATMVRIGSAIFE